MRLRIARPQGGSHLGSTRRWTRWARSIGQRSPADLVRHTLLEEDDDRPSAEYLSWSHWLRLNAPPQLEPRGWIYLNFTYQQIQSALAGQGVALVRESIERGELVEPFGAAGRITSPFAYWLVPWPARSERPALTAFEAWLLEQAALTRQGLAGAVPA